MAREQRDYAVARAYLEENLAIRRESGDMFGLARALCNLGRVERYAGDYAAAQSFFAESLPIRQELGDLWGIVELLEGFACVAIAQGQADRAARLFGMAEALRETIGMTLPAHEPEDYQGNVVAARTALGEDAFAAAWAEGRAMTLEQVLAYALQET